MANHDQQPAHNTSQKPNPYEGLRAMALSTTAKQLGLQLDEDQKRVFGIVMDWHMPNWIATVVAYHTGDASMYMNTGGGMIGGRGNERVRTAVDSYIRLGQHLLHKASEVSTTPLPDNNCVSFYLLTNRGTYCTSEKMENFENGRSDLLPLFNAAQHLLTELRIASEKMKDEAARKDDADPHIENP